MQLTRIDPLLEIDRIQQRLNRLFLDPLKAESTFGNFMPPVDIEETDTEFLVKADLPDVKKDEVKVQVENGVLTIEGERRNVKEEKGRRFHKVEREYGRFIRRFTMPTEIDPEKVRAEFKDGVLNVTVPKAATAKPKSIEVKLTCPRCRAGAPPPARRCWIPVGGGRRQEDRCRASVSPPSPRSRSSRHCQARVSRQASGRRIPRRRPRPSGTPPSAGEI